MKFRKKENQQVLEVLSYEDGPLCYGFYQAKKFYLALFIKNQQEKQVWAYIPLTMKDKNLYEELKDNRLSLGDFLNHKKAYLTTWNARQNQTNEDLITLSKKDIPNYKIQVC